MHSSGRHGSRTGVRDEEGSRDRLLNPASTQLHLQVRSSPKAPGWWLPGSSDEQRPRYTSRVPRARREALQGERGSRNGSLRSPLYASPSSRSRRSSLRSKGNLLLGQPSQDNRRLGFLCKAFLARDPVLQALLAR